MNPLYAPNQEWVAIEFEETALQEAALERLNWSLELPRNHACSFTQPSVLRELLDVLVQRSLQRPEASVAMIRPILGVVAEIMSGSSNDAAADIGTRVRQRQLLLKRADTYLRSNVGQPYDSKALARAVGTTARNLQIHFQQAYGITPGEWARCVALHRVRDSLRCADAARFTVEGLARECGFTHMGRFARYYTELFGELPSVTLRKASEEG
jgi:AraC-like DNA-binding protein